MSPPAFGDGPWHRKGALCMQGPSVPIHPPRGSTGSPGLLLEVWGTVSAVQDTVILITAFPTSCINCTGCVCVLGGSHPHAQRHPSPLSCLGFGKTPLSPSLPLISVTCFLIFHFPCLGSGNLSDSQIHSWKGDPDLALTGWGVGSITQLSPLRALWNSH